MQKKLAKNKKQVQLVKLSKKPLQDIQLSEKEQNKLLLQAFGESLAQEAPFVGVLARSLDRYKARVDQARLNILLQEYQKKFENQEQFKEGMTRLLSSNGGLMLFQKIVRIINNDQIDTEYIKVLTQVLKNVSDSNFEELFQDHNYALSQIEKLSPQALFILSDQKNWPQIKFSSSSASGVTSGEGWDEDFARKYATQKSITETNIHRRISHALHDLKNNNLIELRPNELQLTTTGSEVYKYLT